MAKVISTGTGLPSNDKLMEASPYSEGAKSPKKGQSRRPQPSEAQKAVNKLQAENSRLKAEAQKRKEYTPLFRIIEPKPGEAEQTARLAAVYYGSVAGKAQTREVVIASGKDVSALAPILTPIVSVMNAAIQSRQLESLIAKDQPPAVEKVYTSTSLTKAAYAYQALLANPTFVEQLTQLNETIQQTFENLGTLPKNVRVATHDQYDGHPEWVGQTAALNRELGD